MWKILYNGNNMKIIISLFLLSLSFYNWSQTSNETVAAVVGGNELLVNPSSVCTLEIINHKNPHNLATLPSYIVREHLQFSVISNCSLYIYLYTIDSNNAVSALRNNRGNPISRLQLTPNTPYDFEGYQLSTPIGEKSIFAVGTIAPLDARGINQFTNIIQDAQNTGLHSSSNLQTRSLIPPANIQAADWTTGIMHYYLSPYPPEAPKFTFISPPPELNSNQSILSLPLNIDDGGEAATFKVYANGQPLRVIKGKNIGVEGISLQALELAIPPNLQNQHLNLFVKASNSAGHSSQPIRLFHRPRNKALIIGNSNYPRQPLDNPHNDAKALKEAFTSLGFTVSMHLDINHKEDFHQVISSFASSLEPQDIAVIYFSGHGMQIWDEEQLQYVNYLIPTQASTFSLATLQEDSVSTNYLLNELYNTEVQTTILILDACRNLPDVPPAINEDRNRLGKGLANTEGNHIREGTVIAYAAAPGQTALDSLPNCRHNCYTNCNLSPYVNRLYHALLDPNLNHNILDIFEDVQIKVYRDTAGFQQPEIVSRLYEYINLANNLNLEYTLQCP